MNIGKAGSRRAAALFFCAGVFLAVEHAAAGDLKEIVLSDGSVIQAEVVSLANGVYQLRSRSLGAFSLSEDKIRAIRTQKSGATALGGQGRADAALPHSGADSGAGGMRPQTQGIASQMMADPETMKLIQSLESDPAIHRILEDKELMQAISREDLGRVAMDPKIQALMSSKALEQILQRVNK